MARSHIAAQSQFAGNPRQIHIKYEIVPVGLKAPGRQLVPPSPTAQPGKYTVLEQQARDAMLKGKPPPKHPTGKGFLQHVDTWQEPYLAGEKRRELDYFLS